MKHTQLKEEGETRGKGTYVLDDPNARVVETSGRWSNGMVAFIAILVLAVGFVIGYFIETEMGSDDSPSCSTSSVHSVPGTTTAIVEGGSATPTEPSDATEEHPPQLIPDDRAFSILNGAIPGFPDSRPNIFILLVDDLGWSDISFTGAEYETPSIDEIFNDGMHLSQIYGMPLCTPSRAAMMTGRFSYKMGLQLHEVLHQPTTAGVPLDVPILGEYMKDAGYSTHYFGRWALGHASEEQRPLSRGYDSYNGFLTLIERSYTHITVGSYGDWSVLDWWNGRYPDMPNAVYNDQYSKDLILDKLDELAEDDSDDPWFMTWSTQTIHKSNQVDPPPEVDGLYNDCEGTGFAGGDHPRAVYCKRMKYMDYMFGQVTDKIKEHGWWDNSLVIFTTDNGAAQGVAANTVDKNPNLIQNYGSNYPFRGSKGTYYEGAIRLNTAIGGHWLPENLRGTVDARRHHISDFTPTLMDVAQSDHPLRAEMDGKNFFQEDHNDRLVVSINPLTEITWFGMSPLKMGTAVFLNDYKYIKFSLEYTTNPVRFQTGFVNVSYNIWDGYDADYNNCYVTDENDAFVSGCLFNIKEDPQEQNNLWDSEPDIVDEIEAIIADEFFGPEYRSGQNMEEDMRIYTTNLRETLVGEEWGMKGFYVGSWIGPELMPPWMPEGLTDPSN